MNNTNYKNGHLEILQNNNDDMKPCKFLEKRNDKRLTIDTNKSTLYENQSNNVQNSKTNSNKHKSCDESKDKLTDELWEQTKLSTPDINNNFNNKIQKISNSIADNKNESLTDIKIHKNSKKYSNSYDKNKYKFNLSPKYVNAYKNDNSRTGLGERSKSDFMLHQSNVNDIKNKAIDEKPYVMIEEPENIILFGKKRFSFKNGSEYNKEYAQHDSKKLSIRKPDDSKNMENGKKQIQKSINDEPSHKNVMIIENIKDNSIQNNNAFSSSIRHTENPVILKNEKNIQNNKDKAEFQDNINDQGLYNPGQIKQQGIESTLKNYGNRMFKEENMSNNRNYYEKESTTNNDEINVSNPDNLRPNLLEETRKSIEKPKEVIDKAFRVLKWRGSNISRNKEDYVSDVGNETKDLDQESQNKIAYNVDQMKDEVDDTFKRRSKDVKIVNRLSDVNNNNIQYSFNMNLLDIADNELLRLENKAIKSLKNNEELQSNNEDYNDERNELLDVHTTPNYSYHKPSDIEDEDIRETKETGEEIDNYLSTHYSDTKHLSVDYLDRKTNKNQIHQRTKNDDPKAQTKGRLNTKRINTILGSPNAKGARNNFNSRIQNKETYFNKPKTKVPNIKISYDEDSRRISLRDQIKDERYKHDIEKRASDVERNIETRNQRSSLKDCLLEIINKFLCGTKHDEQ